MKKVRQSNFELMRIVSILFIIIWHIIFHGSIFFYHGEPYIFISNVILAIIIVHVNSLVFITGYFNGNQKKINTKKIFKLIGTVWFYKVLILLILLFLRIDHFNKVTILEEILPLDVRHYWFINCYIIIYILSPYLNKVTENLSEKEFFKFIIKLLVLLSIIPMITQGRFIFNNGYNIINFTIMYYLGSFFKKYPLKDNYFFKKFSQKQIRIILICSLIGIIMTNLSFYYLGMKMTHVDSVILEKIGTIFTDSFLTYSSPLVIIQTCFFCLFFESLTFKNKVINYIATFVFGIYLIHDNAFIRDKIFDWLNVTRAGGSIKSFLVLIESTLIIFVVCSTIEFTRKMLVSFLKKIVKSVKNKPLQ